MLVVLAVSADPCWLFQSIPTRGKQNSKHDVSLKQTSESLNKGHIETSHFFHCKEVVHCFVMANILAI